jgi:hypothetical protein
MHVIMHVFQGLLVIESIFLSILADCSLYYCDTELDRPFYIEDFLLKESTSALGNSKMLAFYIYQDSGVFNSAERILNI